MNCLLVFSVLCGARGGHVVMYHPWSTASHRLQNNAVLEGLLARGHSVTGVTPQPSHVTSLNYTEIVVEDSFSKLMSVITQDMLEKDGTSPWTIMLETVPKLLDIIARELITNRKTCQDLIEKLDRHTEPPEAITVTMHFGFTCNDLYEHFNVPLIGISPPGRILHSSKYLGNPENPSYNTELFLPFVEPLSFKERLISSLVYVVADYEILGWVWQAAIAGFDYLEILDWERWLEITKTRVDLIFFASHHVTHGPSALAPNTIEIGGIQCRDGRPLPPHLQLLLDTHPEGVVYVSFGSTVKPSQMGEEKMKVFLETFAQLSYTVIWKWDGEVMADLPSNVILQSWVPQQDLLAHPHLKVFVTHGGLLSLQETVYHATPIVGIPLGNDQKPNMMRAERRGYAVMLDWPTLNTRDLLAAIIKAATDPETRASMDTAHSLFLDQKETSQSRAVWWIEYTIRHGGAQFLRPGCLSLAWYEYHLIDVIALILTAGLLSSLTLLLCCVKLSKCCTTVTTGKPKTD